MNAIFETHYAMQCKHKNLWYGPNLQTSGSLTGVMCKCNGDLFVGIIGYHYFSDFITCKLKFQI